MTATDERTDLDTALAQARQAYVNERPVGAAMHAEASEVMPGGNTRTVLYHPPFPLRIASGHAQRVVDVDGHEYVDMLGEYTAGLYGHSQKTILDAVRAAMDDGISLAGHNVYEARLARLLVDRFPALDLVRFTNSGTEANLMAISLARVVTGKPAIAVMRGGYHGGLLYYGGGGSPVNAPYEAIDRTLLLKVPACGSAPGCDGSKRAMRSARPPNAPKDSPPPRYLPSVSRSGCTP